MYSEEEIECLIHYLSNRYNNVEVQRYINTKPIKVINFFGAQIIVFYKDFDYFYETPEYITCNNTIVTISDILEIY